MFSDIIIRCAPSGMSAKSQQRFCVVLGDEAAGKFTADYADDTDKNKKILSLALNPRFID